MEAQGWELLLGQRASAQRWGQTLLQDKGSHAGFLVLPVFLPSLSCLVFEVTSSSAQFQEVGVFV